MVSSVEYVELLTVYCVRVQVVLAAFRYFSSMITVLFCWYMTYY